MGVGENDLHKVALCFYLARLPRLHAARMRQTYGLHWSCRNVPRWQRWRQRWLLRSL